MAVDRKDVETRFAEQIDKLAALKHQVMVHTHTLTEGGAKEIPIHMLRKNPEIRPLEGGISLLLSQVGRIASGSEELHRGVKDQRENANLIEISQMVDRISRERAEAMFRKNPKLPGSEPSV